MNCRDVKALLGAHSGSDLDTAQADQMAAHVEHCHDCAAELEPKASWDGLLRQAILEPGDQAAAEGRFDAIWAHVEAAITPPRPSFTERLQAWWQANGLVLAPAMAGAAALVLVAGLWVTRTGTAPDGGLQVAEAPVQELPPFAAPRLAPDTPPTALAAGTPDEGAPADQPAPRRRGPEQMVALNESVIVDFEVDRGTVIVEQYPEDPDHPVVVWHLLDDNGGPWGGDGESI